jgi:hypothetical protein
MAREVMASNFEKSAERLFAATERFFRATAALLAMDCGKHCACSKADNSSGTARSPDWHPGVGLDRPKGMEHPGRLHSGRGWRAPSRFQTKQPPPSDYIVSLCQTRSLAELRPQL